MFESITPATAERVIASVLVNHDSIPDLEMLAATIAMESGRQVLVDEVRSALAREGYRFTAEGWMIGEETDS